MIGHFRGAQSTPLASSTAPTIDLVRSHLTICPLPDQCASSDTHWRSTTISSCVPVQRPPHVSVTHRAPQQRRRASVCTVCCKSIAQGRPIQFERHWSGYPTTGRTSEAGSDPWLSLRTRVSQTVWARRYAILLYVRYFCNRLYSVHTLPPWSPSRRGRDVAAAPSARSVLTRPFLPMIRFSDLSYQRLQPLPWRHQRPNSSSLVWSFCGGGGVSAVTTAGSTDTGYSTGGGGGANECHLQGEKEWSRFDRPTPPNI